MELDVIIVSIVFVIFCVGGYILVKKAEQELQDKEFTESKNIKNKSDDKK